MSKKATKIAVWVMLIAMIASAVAVLVMYI